jgi:hypothetical protein
MTYHSNTRAVDGIDPIGDDTNWRESNRVCTSNWRHENCCQGVSPFNYKLNCKIRGGWLNVSQQVNVRQIMPASKWGFNGKISAPGRSAVTPYFIFESKANGNGSSNEYSRSIINILFYIFSCLELL